MVQATLLSPSAQAANLVVPANSVRLTAPTGQLSWLYNPGCNVSTMIATYNARDPGTVDVVYSLLQAPQFITESLYQYGSIAAGQLPCRTAHITPLLPQCCWQPAGMYPPPLLHVRNQLVPLARAGTTTCPSYATRRWRRTFTTQSAWPRAAYRCRPGLCRCMSDSWSWGGGSGGAWWGCLWKGIAFLKFLKKMQLRLPRLPQHFARCGAFTRACGYLAWPLFVRVLKVAWRNRANCAGLIRLPCGRHNVRPRQQCRNTVVHTHTEETRLHSSAADECRRSSA